jgi:uncharacterized protein RhaS with RHS repeats
VVTQTYWDGHSNNYCYDSLNRVSSVTGAIPEAWAYDAYGNITTYTNYAGTQTPLPVDSNNRLNGSGFTTDGAGNVIATPSLAALGLGAHSFTYFATGELKSVTDMGYTYTYDGQNRRFESNLPGGVRHYFTRGAARA